MNSTNWILIVGDVRKVVAHWRGEDIGVYGWPRKCIAFHGRSMEVALMGGVL